MNKKLLLATAAFLSMSGSVHAQTIGPPNAVLCNRVTVSAANLAAGTSTLVAGVAGQQIAVCGFVAASGVSTAGSIQLTFSAVGCTTNANPITPVMGMPANTTISEQSPYAMVMGPVGLSLCAVAAGTTTMQTSASWSQF